MYISFIYVHIDSQDEINSRSGDPSRSRARDTSSSMLDPEFQKFKNMNEKSKIQYFKRKGITMREFAPFYDLKSMDKLYSAQEIRK